MRDTVFLSSALDALGHRAVKHCSLAWRLLDCHNGGLDRLRFLCETPIHPGCPWGYEIQSTMSCNHAGESVDFLCWIRESTVPNG